MMMIRTVLMTLVGIAAVYATEQQGGTLLRGAGGNIPELLGAEELIDVEAGEKSCTYEPFTFGSDNCPVGYYCNIGKGKCVYTGVAKVRGVCKPSPTSCPANGNNKVCGCDRSTWKSPCEAAKFGENIAYDGVCRV
jgi:hypothetical protein